MIQKERRKEQEMRYLFATLMWNGRAAVPELQDIFAICCQLNEPDKIVSYAHYVHPEDVSSLTDETKEAVYNNLAVLEMAKPLTEIIDKMTQTFSGYDVLVMWSRQAYELLRRAFRENGHRLQTTRVVLLEELVATVVHPKREHRGLGFRRALRLFGIHTTDDTFYQLKGRAGYLFLLWDRLSQLAEKSPEWGQTQLCWNEKTRCVHLPGCRYLFQRAEETSCTPQVLLEGGVLCRECQKKGELYFWTRAQVREAVFETRIKVLAEPQNWPRSPGMFYRTDDPEKLYHSRSCTCYHQGRNGEGYQKWLPLFSVEEARKAGRKACALCSPMGVRYQQVRQQAQEFCAQRGMECEIQDGVLEITTPVSRWKLIYRGDGKLALYHKNTWKSHPDEQEMVPGYHSQAIHKKNILEYLEYIVQHDLYRKNNPLPAPEKKTKADKKPAATHHGRGHNRTRKEIRHCYLPKKKKVVRADSLEELQELARQKIAAQNTQK